MHSWTGVLFKYMSTLWTLAKHITCLGYTLNTGTPTEHRDTRSSALGKYWTQEDQLNIGIQANLLWAHAKQKSANSTSSVSLGMQTLNTVTPTQQRDKSSSALSTYWTQGLHIIRCVYKLKAGTSSEYRIGQHKQFQMWLVSRENQVNADALSVTKGLTMKLSPVREGVVFTILYFESCPHDWLGSSQIIWKQADNPLPKFHNGKFRCSIFFVLIGIRARCWN